MEEIDARRRCRRKCRRRRGTDRARRASPRTTKGAERTSSRSEAVPAALCEACTRRGASSGARARTSGRRGLREEEELGTLPVAEKGRVARSGHRFSWARVFGGTYGNQLAIRCGLLRHVGDCPRKESQNGEKAPNAFGARKSATSVRLLSRARANTRTPARVGPRIADPKSAARVSRLRRSERYAPSRTRDAKRDWRIDRGERRARSIRDARTTTQSWRPWICSSAR